MRAATNLGCRTALVPLLANYQSCVPILSRSVVIRRGNPCDSYRRAFLGRVSRVLVVQDDARLSPVERALPARGQSGWVELPGVAHRRVGRRRSEPVEVAGQLQCRGHLVLGELGLVLVPGRGSRPQQ